MGRLIPGVWGQNPLLSEANESLWANARGLGAEPPALGNFSTKITHFSA